MTKYVLPTTYHYYYPVYYSLKPILCSFAACLESRLFCHPTRLNPLAKTIVAQKYQYKNDDTRALTTYFRIFFPRYVQSVTPTFIIIYVIIFYNLRI